MSEKEQEKAEILKQTTIEVESPSDSLANKLKEKKRKQKKKKNRRIIALCLIAFITLFVKWLLKPFQESAEYGICRSFLELHVPYPHTIYVSEIKPIRDGGLKIWYTHIDAFGEYRIEDYQCKISPNKDTGMPELQYIKMHKVALEPDKIKHLNNAMPYFIANPLILDWPTPLPDSLNDLHFEFDSFRKIIINPNK